MVLYVQLGNRNALSQEKSLNIFEQGGVPAMHQGHGLVSTSWEDRSGGKAGQKPETGRPVRRLPKSIRER